MAVKRTILVVEDEKDIRELVRFHRQEEMKKLRGIFRALWKRQKIDSFRAGVLSGLSECNGRITG